MGLLTGVFIFISIVILFVFIVAWLFSDEIKATREKDPAATGYLEIVLFYPGLHALISHRIAHFLWNSRFHFVALMLSQISRFITGIEIHPGAKIGHGLFIDHGMGVVIRETTVIGEHVTLFQGVTLGGTGKETGKRHPTLKDGIVVGAGAKILGNIEVGSNSYIGANAVVIKTVPSNTTIVGVPGRITRQEGKKIDTQMDHSLILDPVMQALDDLKSRVDSLEQDKK